MTALLEARRITKRYPPIVAVENVSLTVGEGEVLGLIGENGAGKSTLLSILGGAAAADSGELYIRGKKLQFRSPADARAAGIAVVRQHESLILRFSVAENLALAAGVEAFPNKSKMEGFARTLASRYGLDPGDPNAPCETLSVGARQRVEILKALARPADILLLDEPTAALSPREVGELLHVIRNLSKAGVAVVLVDHKLHEVLAVCERIVILRKGKVVSERAARGASEEILAFEMIGTPTPPAERPAPPRENEILLSVDGLSTARRGPGSVALDQLNFTISRGEILGVAGVDGNGQRELVEALLGILNLTNGTARHGSLAAIAPDRRAEGLILQFGVGENLLLDHFLLKKSAPRGILLPAAARAAATAAIEKYQIRAGGPDAPAASLSGGNQQKIVVARALARDPTILVAANPTRGLDVDAAGFVHREILNFTKNGGGVLYISTDLDEIAKLCHRAIVLSRGAARGPFTIPWSDDDLQTIGNVMAGAER